MRMARWYEDLGSALGGPSQGIAALVETVVALCSRRLWHPPTLRDHQTSLPWCPSMGGALPTRPERSHGSRSSLILFPYEAWVNRPEVMHLRHLWVVGVLNLHLNPWLLSLRRRSPHLQE